MKKQQELPLATTYVQPITTCVTICDYHDEKKRKKEIRRIFITRIASHPRNKIAHYFQPPTPTPSLVQRKGGRVELGTKVTVLIAGKIIEHIFYVFVMEEVKGTNMHFCSFNECQFRRITTLDATVEVRASVPMGGFSKLQEPKVKWKRSGDAVFHRDCWDLVVKICRMRSKKRAPFVISAAEKTLVKEALKTAEFHDSLGTVTNEASRIADLIKNAEHCVAFTGAGISTSAGIGDYRGKSGKWTEEDR